MNKQNEKIGLLISGGNLIFYFRIKFIDLD